jgi:hypothetical protein
MFIVKFKSPLVIELSHIKLSWVFGLSEKVFLSPYDTYKLMILKYFHISFDMHSNYILALIMEVDNGYLLPSQYITKPLE